MAAPQNRTAIQRTCDFVSVIFTLIIVVYAASGPLTDFVRWFIETTTAGFEELSRRDQRILFKEHWLGAGLKSFERNFLLLTGMILGLPLLLSFIISFLNLPKKRALALFAIA